MLFAFLFNVIQSPSVVSAKHKIIYKYVLSIFVLHLTQITQVVYFAMCLTKCKGHFLLRICGLKFVSWLSLAILTLSLQQLVAML